MVSLGASRMLDTLFLINGARLLSPEVFKYARVSSTLYFNI
jgi:hypothetical protein